MRTALPEKSLMNVYTQTKLVSITYIAMTVVLFGLANVSAYLWGATNQFYMLILPIMLVTSMFVFT